MVAPGRDPGVGAGPGRRGTGRDPLLRQLLDGLLYVAYTGVDPAFRGRGLARLVKQQAHLDGARRRREGGVHQQRGAQHRDPRLNAELGYVVESGTYRLQRQL